MCRPRPTTCTIEVVIRKGKGSQQRKRIRVTNAYCEALLVGWEPLQTGNREMPGVRVRGKRTAAPECGAPHGEGVPSNPQHGIHLGLMFEQAPYLRAYERENDSSCCSAWKELHQSSGPATQSEVQGSSSCGESLSAQGASARNGYNGHHKTICRLSVRRANPHRRRNVLVRFPAPFVGAL